MFDNNNYRLSVDWLNLRLDVSHPNDFIKALEEKLGLMGTNWFDRNGSIDFYQNSMFYAPVGYGGIVIGWNVDENGEFLATRPERLKPYGLLLSVSGDGCRYINSLYNGAFQDFLSVVCSFPVHCSRCDIALDIFDPDNELVPLIHDYADTYYSDEQKYYFNCNLKRSDDFLQIHRVYDRSVGRWTDNVTIGSRKCTKGQMQLYNKGVEVRSGRLSEMKEQLLSSVPDTNYWWRLELRTKSNADKTFELLSTKGIYHAAVYSIFEFGDFVVAKYGEDNVSKCPTVTVWSDLYNWLFAMSETELAQTINFVQFVSLPFVGTSLQKFIKYSERVPSLFYKAFNILLFDERRRRQILSDGSVRFNKNKSNSLAFSDEFNSSYGDMLPPEVIERILSLGLRSYVMSGAPYSDMLKGVC